MVEQNHSPHGQDEIERDIYVNIEIGRERGMKGERERKTRVPQSPSKAYPSDLTSSHQSSPLKGPTFSQ
jgi:hypothetical protein